MTDVKTNAFVEAIKNIKPYSLKENEILTENGAIQLKSSGSNIVDQFGKAKEIFSNTDSIPFIKELVTVSLDQWF